MEVLVFLPWEVTILLANKSIKRTIVSSVVLTGFDVHDISITDDGR